MQRKVAYFLLASILLTACASGGDVPNDEEDQTTNDDGDVKDPIDPAHVRQAKEPILRDPEVVQAFAYDISPPLREIEPLPLIPQERVRDARPIPRPASVNEPSNDRALQTTAPENVMPAALQNFDGLGSGTNGFTVVSAPPDTDGDVGPNHYVQIVNSGYAVFNKSGQKVFGPVNTNTLWSGFGGGCQQNNDGDGTVRYDRAANRWIIAQFAVNGGNGPFFQCVAVSTTGDPTGSFARYSFPFTAFNDYPKASVWPDAYYFTFNMFPNLQFAGAKICAMDRAKMIAGQAATMQCFDTTDKYGGVLMSDWDGVTAPPAGAPAYGFALGIANNDLAFWKAHIDWSSSANSTFTGPTAITVEAYTAMCAGQQSCVTQPGAFVKLDGLDDRLMNRAVYRNFGDHDAVVFGHAVQRTGGGGGMRWYEIRNMNATPTVFQQGTLAPDADFRWMGSLAFDKSGAIAMGFARSGTIKPSILYTARVPGDPAGTMGQGEATLQAGGGIQNGFNFLTRWGDYSSLNIDPSDDCTFWYTQEYLKANGEFNWNTRVGSFKLASCGAAGGDTTPPTTSITAPAGGAQVSGSITITATAADNVGVTKVEFYADTTLLGTATAAPYNLLWDTKSIADGAHTLKTKAYDAAGNSGSSTGVSITVKNGGGGDTTAPTTSLTAPAAGSTLSGSVAVSANAADNVGVVRVDFYAGTTLIGSDTSSPYSISWDTKSVADGATTLTSKAFDAAGNSGTSAGVSVTVKNGTVTGTELVVNGGFETGTTSGWTQSGRVGATHAHYASGTYSARVGSTVGYNGDSTLAQTITVPASGTTTLTFRYLLRCQTDTVEYDQQGAYVTDVNGKVLLRIFEVCDYTTSWAGATADLTPFAGQKVQILFKDHDDGVAVDPTWFYVDKVSAKNSQ